jgi:hypothetical protein
MHLLHAVPCMINRNDELRMFIHYIADEMIYPGNLNNSFSNNFSLSKSQSICQKLKGSLHFAK